ncbi:MAG: DNA-formamidopyrimidine glycosylase, partial [Bacilli bacterium]|nr:DNA-formamidopyrimidine glycosylase [Bacilli bacterium]
ADKIVKYTKETLDDAVKLGGTTIKSFTSDEGVHGLFQNKLLVHGKKDEPCPNCGSIIVKEKIGGRGTYYCPKCQK